MELLAHNFSARKIREFADAATDALYGSRGTVNGWDIELSPNGLRLARRGMFIDSPREVFTDLIAQIDQLLED
ncbi:MAG: hypothetical protein EOP24_37475 [Hyphomicrobiales bacterium]|nr:MAG: hypothetical protein EOP24_37475 [Hyphomicrobiales bacterium]